jgi:hypothetical protein
VSGHPVRTGPRLPTYDMGLNTSLISLETVVEAIVDAVQLRG